MTNLDINCQVDHEEKGTQTGIYHVQYLRFENDRPNDCEETE
jgi:hypothetical protein